MHQDVVELDYMDTLYADVNTSFCDEDGEMAPEENTKTEYNETNEQLLYEDLPTTPIEECELTNYSDAVGEVISNPINKKDDSEKVKEDSRTSIHSAEYEQYLYTLDLIKEEWERTAKEKIKFSATLYKLLSVDSMYARYVVKMKEWDQNIDREEYVRKCREWQHKQEQERYERDIRVAYEQLNNKPRRLQTPPPYRAECNSKTYREHKSRKQRDGRRSSFSKPRYIDHRTPGYKSGRRYYKEERKHMSYHGREYGRKMKKNSRR